MDARDSQRVSLDCPVIFLGDHIVGEGRIINLSTPGCAIESRTAVEAGNYFALQIQMPDHPEPLVILLAAVRWAFKGQFGLELIRMGEGQQGRLRRFLTERGVSAAA